MIVTEGTSKIRARHEVPVLASLGLRAAAAADLFASLARLLSPMFDVLAAGVVVGRIMKAYAAPLGSPWF